jgi:hypothetical protein
VREVVQKINKKNQQEASPKRRLTDHPVMVIKLLKKKSNKKTYLSKKQKMRTKLLTWNQGKQTEGDLFMDIQVSEYVLLFPYIMLVLL